MTGTIHDGELTRHVRSPADGATPGPCVVLARGARAQLTCGAVTFLVARTERPPALHAAPFPWRAAENRYHLAAALGVAMILWMLLSVPGDPRALALDVFASDRGLVKFVIKPPVNLALDAPGGGGGVAAPAGRPGHAPTGPSGVIGTETSRDRNHGSARQGVLAVHQPQPSLAPAPIHRRQAGVLGVFQQVLEQSAAAQEVLAARWRRRGTRPGPRRAGRWSCGAGLRAWRSRRHRHRRWRRRHGPACHREWSLRNDGHRRWWRRGQQALRSRRRRRRARPAAHPRRRRHPFQRAGAWRPRLRDCPADHSAATSTR